MKKICQRFAWMMVSTTYSIGWGTFKAPRPIVASGDVKAVALVASIAKSFDGRSERSGCALAARLSTWLESAE